MAEQTFTKATDYHSEVTDFQGENEIMVTITLGEYRKLVKSDATKQYEVSKANATKYEMESENKKLREEILLLKEKLYLLTEKADERVKEVE